MPPCDHAQMQANSWYISNPNEAGAASMSATAWLPPCLKQKLKWRKRLNLTTSNVCYNVISCSDSLFNVKSIAKQNPELISQLRESRWNKIVVENPSISRPFQPNPRSLGVLRRAGDVSSVSVRLHSFTNERVEETSFIFVGLRFPSLYWNSRFHLQSKVVK